MNSYQATLKKIGWPDSKFDMLKNNINEAALFAEKIGKENGCDRVEVKNSQLHKGTEEYILKTYLK
jgi:hypothetical protein